jgi:tetratricopeptide repeat protein 8
MGVSSAELFNNMALCCFYAQQYDLCLGLFERALSLATDTAMADVWYNISHVALSLGDLSLAYQVGVWRERAERVCV